MDIWIYWYMADNKKKNRTVGSRGPCVALWAFLWPCVALWPCGPCHAVPCAILCDPVPCGKLWQRGKLWPCAVMLSYHAVKLWQAVPI